jgi:DNA polymerase-1
MKAPTTIDFETEAITDAGKPPKPVGVAIMVPGKAAKYYAWGHPVENNCTEEEARRALKAVWGGPLLMHNAYFDIGVAWRWMGLPIPADFHDTLFTLYLVDPHADTISLKPASVKHLGMDPDEQEAVRDWLIEHGIVRKGQKDWGAFISKAPGKLVGEYAKGDVVRTQRLHDKLYPTLDARMREAYQREIRLLPFLLMNEMQGMRLDVGRLEYDIKIYEKALGDADAAIRKKLKCKDLNVDAPADVAAALKSSGIVKAFKKTPTGRDSTAKGNLTEDMFSDPEAYRLLGYRGRLETVLANSMRPWLAAVDGRGYIHTAWNQVRSTDTGGAKGTRTGRLSCSRFMNIAKAWEGFVPPRGGLPALPLVRRYILADDNTQTIVHRDYNQQEFRILAHFEDGVLMDEYRRDPRIDYHTKMKALIEAKTGKVLERRTVKILNFGILYGMGGALLASKLGCSVDEALALRKAQKAATPGVAALDTSLKALGREGKPIRTWGGRQYYCEPPKLVDGQMRSFEYKLLNYLIQGSAADCTKEALIRYHQHPKRRARMMVTVHDEINVSSEAVNQDAEVLREVMESIEFDVPMLSDVKVGLNWGDLR